MTHRMIEQVEPMIPALRRYARSLIGDVHAADDLVQDCLERVVGNWHRRRKDDARAWIFAILHNLAANFLRRKARRGPHLDIDGTDTALPSQAATQDDGLVRRDLLAAFDLLTEDQRSVLLLISVEEMSYAQAAEILDIPVGTVMSRLARGRERLRAILENGPAAAQASHLRRVK